MKSDHRICSFSAHRLKLQMANEFVQCTVFGRVRIACVSWIINELVQMILIRVELIGR